MGAVYDPARRVVMLFGGQQSELYNDVWAFDTESETWSQVTTQGTQPDIRYGHGTALDAVNDQLVISHGFARDGRHDDTWALDLKTNTWKDLTPEGTKPLKRCLLEADFSGISESVYLFGGCSSGFGPCPQGDLWSFDLKSNTWTELVPTGPAPSARENPALVVEPRTGGLILFGGNAGGPVNDLWKYDPAANTWNEITLAGPSARKSHDAVYDAAHNRLFLFGGSTANGAVNDLWVLEL
jgi:N-acetylneuraminic acid mutarotase